MSAHGDAINAAFRKFRAAVGDNLAREWLYSALDYFHTADRFQARTTDEGKAEASAKDGAQ